MAGKSKSPSFVLELKLNTTQKIDINTAQKAASQVWKSVEDVLYRKGETVHFRKFDSFLSVEGKNNSSGICFRGGRLRWFDPCIQPKIKHSDTYAMDALNNRVKYCRIVRRVMGIRYHYYCSWCWKEPLR